jgi:hypothetical protein
MQQPKSKQRRFLEYISTHFLKTEKSQVIRNGSAVKFIIISSIWWRKTGGSCRNCSKGDFSGGKAAEA